MTDLNMMMREQARTGLQVQLDKAVTDGDTAEAAKIADKIATLAVNNAPKAPPFNNDDIKAQLDKQPWFGIDPKKSARVIELGKHMDPKKFGTAEAFAAALVKAVDEEFKPAGSAAEPEGDGEAGDEDGEAGEAAPAPKKPRRTDGPGEGDATNRSAPRRAAGPWTKLSDAPGDVQTDINRAADKFVRSSAPKEQREAFVKKALESHYAAHQRSKGKK